MPLPDGPLDVGALRGEREEPVGPPGFERLQELLVARAKGQQRVAVLVGQFPQEDEGARERFRLFPFG